MPTALSSFAFAAAIFAAPVAAPPADYLSWQQQRVASLSAEKGWLTLIGLHWLEPGRHRIGSGAGSAVRLNAGPELLGEIELSAAGEITFYADPKASVLVAGKTPNKAERLFSDAEQAVPTEVSTGTVSFFVVNRSGKLGLRVKDSNSTVRTQFQGLDYFAYAPNMVINARFEAYPESKTIDIVNILGMIEPTPNPGRAHFDFGGKSYSIELLEGSDAEHYFTVFGDQTNGKETYGMARFLAGSLDRKNNTVVLDFNRAYNPPCAFTEYATCPMPPPTNRIAAKINAGEKTYRGGHK